MPCAEEDRIIASKKVTQLYAKPVPFTATAASPLLSCSRVITILHPFLRSPLDRSLLPRSISSKIRYGRSSAAEVLRSCPPRHCVPSSIPPSLRCEVMQVIFRYLVSHSKFWGESTDGRFHLGRTRFFRSRSRGEEEGDGRREGGEILTRVAKAR